MLRAGVLPLLRPGGRWREVHMLLLLLLSACWARCRCVQALTTAGHAASRQRRGIAHAAFNGNQQAVCSIWVGPDRLHSVEGASQRFLVTPRLVGHTRLRLTACTRAQRQGGSSDGQWRQRGSSNRQVIPVG